MSKPPSFGVRKPFLMQGAIDQGKRQTYAQSAESPKNTHVSYLQQLSANTIAISILFWVSLSLPRRFWTYLEDLAFEVFEGKLTIFPRRGFTYKDIRKEHPKQNRAISMTRTCSMSQRTYCSVPLIPYKRPRRFGWVLRRSAGQLAIGVRVRKHLGKIAQTRPMG